MEVELVILEGPEVRNPFINRHGTNVRHFIGKSNE
jgi:hypothetical protein